MERPGRCMERPGRCMERPGRCMSKYETVDASEIPFPTTWDGEKNFVNNGINYTSTGSRFQPSTVLLMVQKSGTKVYYIPSNQGTWRAK